MELVLKLPPNKPPFIGLVYPDYESAIAHCDYLLEIDPANGFALNIRLDGRETKLKILINYREYKTIKISTNEFLAVKEHKKFERVDSVNFGPVVKAADGTHLPVWSEKHNKWIFAKTGAVGFSFRSHL